MAQGTIEELYKTLEDVQVDKVGTCQLEDFKDAPFYDKALKLLPGAKSIILLALEVFPEVIIQLSSKVQVGELALRDLANRNMEIVNGQLDWETYKIVKKLHKLGFKGVPLPAGGAPYDARQIEGMLSYKDFAHVAGLGVIGWHSMVLTPDYGSRVRLAGVLTDAPFESSVSEETELPCIKCGGACIKICPVSAIQKPQGGETSNVNKYACSAYLTASCGCAECLRVCPAGKA